VPIVPVVAAPLEPIVDTRRLLARPGRIAMLVLDPIPPPPDGDEAAIAASATAVRAAMQAELERLRTAESRDLAIS
jgi:1-acyl-sn-glycerol-3-phosphate acyltransferase